MPIHPIHTVLLGLATLLLGNSGARAELSAGELLQACDEVEASGRIEGSTANIPDTARAGLCLGYVSAVLGATLYGRPDESRVLGICTPEHLNAYELARITRRFVQAQPRYAQERAIVVVLSAARQAYPCPPGS